MCVCVEISSSTIEIVEIDTKENGIWNLYDSKSTSE